MMDAEQEQGASEALPEVGEQHPDNGDPEAVEVDYSGDEALTADDTGLGDLLSPVSDDDPIVGD